MNAVISNFWRRSVHVVRPLEQGVFLVLPLYAPKEQSDIPNSILRDISAHPWCCNWSQGGINNTNVARECDGFKLRSLPLSLVHEPCRALYLLQQSNYLLPSCPLQFSSSSRRWSRILTTSISWINCCDLAIAVAHLPSAPQATAIPHNAESLRLWMTRSKSKRKNDILPTIWINSLHGFRLGRGWLPCTTPARAMRATCSPTFLLTLSPPKPSQEQNIWTFVSLGDYYFSIFDRRNMSSWTLISLKPRPRKVPLLTKA